MFNLVLFMQMRPLLSFIVAAYSYTLANWKVYRIVKIFVCAFKVKVVDEKGY